MWRNSDRGDYPFRLLIPLFLLALAGAYAITVVHQARQLKLSPLPESRASYIAEIDSTAWRLASLSQPQADLTRVGTSLHIDIHSPLPTGPYITCFRNGLVFEVGNQYLIKFRARTNQPRHIAIQVRWLDNSYEAGTSESVFWIGTEWRSFTCIFNAKRKLGALTILLGRLPGEVVFSDIAVEDAYLAPQVVIKGVLADHPILHVFILSVAIVPALSGLHKHTSKTASRMLLSFLAFITAADYLIWRVLTLHNASPWLAYILFFAEVSSIIQVLGFHYSVWPIRLTAIKRTSQRFTQNDRTRIVIFVPTVNEGVEVLQTTLLGAKQAQAKYCHEFRNDTVQIVVGNDGLVGGYSQWQTVDTLSKQLDVTCITREQAGGGKAGNIEHARNVLGLTGDDLLVLFDADQIPHPDFLLKTVPYFADSTVGWVQTPQWYRNLQDPVASWAQDQQSLFYDVLMVGKARVNAAGICGTNVVIRAGALEEVGGFPLDSVTEDTAVSIKMHARWRGIYFPERLAVGLGPIDIAGYFSQQRRWSTGMLEILLRTGTAIIFTRPGLSVSQRIHYLLSCSHYLCGIQNLLLFLAPVCFLFFPRNALAFGMDVPGLSWHFLPFLLITLVSSPCNFRAQSLLLGSTSIYIESLFTVAFGRRVTFIVTPKRRGHRLPILSLVLPTLMLVAGFSALLFGVASLKNNPFFVDWFPILLSIAWISYQLTLLLNFFLLVLRTHKQAPLHPRFMRVRAKGWHWICITVTVSALLVGAILCVKVQARPRTTIVLSRSSLDKIVSAQSPLAQWTPFTNTQNSAVTWSLENRLEHPAAAALLNRLGHVPAALWLDKEVDIRRSGGLDTYMDQVPSEQIPTLVVYLIPHRDNGGESGGGVASAKAYRSIITTLNDVIGNRPAIVVLEPDALALLPNLAPAAAKERIALLRFAARKLSKPSNRFVYLDAGHAGWLPAHQVANLLGKCGIEYVRGFSLNVSNFQTVEESTHYALALSHLTGGKSAVVDTSRCGNGPAPDGQWCNPSGRAFGQMPTTKVSYPLDALLWVKNPWESDGSYQDAPPAGALYPEYAVQLGCNSELTQLPTVNMEP